MAAQHRRDDRVRKIVHLVEGKANPRSAKTARGVLKYSHHPSVGLIDSTSVGKTAQQLFGCGGDIPTFHNLGEFFQNGLKPDTLVVGVTPVGGVLPANMRRHVLDALEAGLDVWSGMHTFLGDDHEFRLAAEQGGGQIWDVRRPPADLPVGHGHMINSKSYCALMVGTDCALGKMTAGLEIQIAARAKGISSEFVSTGQTGMMITGWGHPIDAIPGDFMCGCVEKDCLSVDGKCDIIIVEGQGSVIHPGYSPVTLGLMHGCMPDAMIMCHQPGRNTISNREHVPIPKLGVLADLYLAMQAHFKPSKFVGVCLNTYGMDEKSALDAVKAAEDDMQLPATDPCRFSLDPLLASIEAHRKSVGK